MNQFEGINVGDRVQLLNPETNDIAEFTVTVAGGSYLESKGNFFPANSDWVVGWVKSLLPTQHGAVVGHPKDSTWHPYMFDSNQEAWFEVGSNTRASEFEIRELMREHGFVVLYEGIVEIEEI